MSKVLLMGACPLPTENALRVSAPGGRTWQFAKPILAAGHSVVAVCLADTGAYPPDEPPAKMRREAEMTVHVLDVTEYEKIGPLQSIHDEFTPDCIVTSSSFLPSYFAAHLETAAPLWIDQNGDLMAEAQMLAAIHDDDEALTHYATALEQILARGDIFSAQSARQRYALIGQLAARGRLNKQTVGYEFVHVIPDAHDGKPVHTRDVIRGVLCDRAAFVVLWSGGYNTWTDVDSLFDALEGAMEANPAIHFASTGGGLPGLVESTYRRFEEMTAASKYADRFHLMGWVRREDAANAVLEADLGINIDQPCYETELGSRTRLLGWWGTGLPALTTNGCELTDIAARAGAVATFPQRDAESLAQEILALARDKERLARIAQAAQTLVVEQFSYETTTRPLLEWLARPEHAPDYGAARKPNGLDADVLREMERKVAHYREKLDEIRSSRTWRLASLLHTFTRWFGVR